MGDDSFRHALDTAALPVEFDPMLGDYAAMVEQIEATRTAPKDGGASAQEEVRPWA